MGELIKPKVYVIVLNWNNYACSVKCLESLQKATYPNLEIIVVDNGSTDKSGKRLQSEFPDYRFIFNDENLGFARGCNVGIRDALSNEDCAYVLLLNNDATVTPQFLEKAVDTAGGDERIAVIGGKLIYSPESNKISYAGGYVDRLRAGCMIRGSLELDEGQYDRPGKTGFVSGALMLIKRKTLEELGLLPEEYFFGVEDVDYALKIRRAGYKLYYVPEFVAYHGSDGSHRTFDPRYSYIGYRSRFILQEKYLPKGLFPIWLWVFFYYEKYIAFNIWKRLVTKYGYDKDLEISFDDIKFALIKAIEDHGKDMLSERTLIQFGELLKARKTPSA